MGTTEMDLTASVLIAFQMANNRVKWSTQYARLRSSTILMMPKISFYWSEQLNNLIGTTQSLKKMNKTTLHIVNLKRSMLYSPLEYIRKSSGV